jgi:antirestriction protein ArdC
VEPFGLYPFSEELTMRNNDAYQLITDRIVTLLNTGTIPWHKPWNVETGMPKNLASG